MLVSMLERLFWLRLTGQITLVPDVKMDESVLEEKSSFTTLGLPSYSKFAW